MFVYSTGRPTIRSMRPGRGQKRPTGRHARVPRKYTGRTGTWCLSASKATPGLNGCNCPSREREPSGNTITFAPAFSASMQRAVARPSKRSRRIGIEFPSNSANTRRNG